MRKKVNSKCYMCERRHPACQDKCPDYLAWKANLDATNAKIKDEKKKFEDMGSYNRPVAVSVPSFTFPGILTEKYFRNEADDIYRAEVQQRVLVAPKVIVLRAGDLVQKGNETPYTVRQVLDLDPYKNEYVIERSWEA